MFACTQTGKNMTSPTAYHSNGMACLDPCIFNNAVFLVEEFAFATLQGDLGHPVYLS